MTDCVFCDLSNIKGVSYVGDEVVMFEPLNPVTPGHLLFVPIQHVKHAARRPELTAKVFEAAANYAKERRLPFNLITSAGEHATQTVNHLHVHFVPRGKDDGLKLPWTEQRA